MDRKYDGHAWCKLQTNNIKNLLKQEIQLIFFIEQLLLILNLDQNELYHFEIPTKVPIFFWAYEIKYVSYKY
jgi:hypothetical protein